MNKFKSGEKKESSGSGDKQEKKSSSSGKKKENKSSKKADDNDNEDGVSVISLSEEEVESGNKDNIIPKPVRAEKSEKKSKEEKKC